MKIINRIVPELALKRFEKEYETNPPVFKHQKDGFYFMIDSFYRFRAYNKNPQLTKDGLITITSKHFRNYLGKNYYLYRIWLEKSQIIVCDQIKKEGKSYAYGIHPDVNSKGVPVTLSKNSVIRKKIIEIRNKQKKLHKNPGEHILQMKKEFNNIKIDIDKAMLWLEKNLEKKIIDYNKYNASLISIYMIEEKDFYFNINSTNGRLDTNLTNLKSDLRKYIIGDYYQLDLKNSQPLILNFILKYVLENGQYLSKLKHSNPPPPYIYPFLGTNSPCLLDNKLKNNELRRLKNIPFSDKDLIEITRYKEDTFYKDFYEEMSKDYFKNKNLGQDSRKDMKVLLYKIFFSKNESYKEEKKIFSKKYPFVYNLISKLKSNQHNTLALCLQKIESDIFIKIVAKKICEKKIIPLTIHDSIVVPKEHLEISKKILIDTYLELFGETPQFQCSKL